MKREPLLIRDNHSIRKIDEVYMVTRDEPGKPKSVLYHIPGTTRREAWDRACAAYGFFYFRRPTVAEMKKDGWKCELISLCVETPIPNIEDEDPQLGGVPAERKSTGA